MKNIFKRKKYFEIPENPFRFFDDDHFNRSTRVGNIKRGKNDLFDFSSENAESSEFVGKSFKNNRVTFFIAFLYAGIALIIFKGFYLQIVKGADYHQLAEHNRIHIDYITTIRGLIYDRNGKLLVKNTPKFIISIIPAELPFDGKEKESVLEKTSSILNISVDEIKKTIEPIKPSSLYFYQPVMIKDNVAYEEAIRMTIEQDFLKGVAVNTTVQREYLNSFGLSHVLGYTGKVSQSELLADEDKKYLLTDTTGKTGVEKSFDNLLRGKHGTVKTEVDAYGREKKILEKNDRQLGNNIVLTIDQEMQKKMEEIMISHIAKIGKRKAAAIILNPKNGEILSLVTLPTFDNNDFSFGIQQNKYDELIKDPDRPLFSRAWSGEYPSGSTFKMILAAAGLQEGVINEHTSILSTGGIRVGEWFFPDWKIGGHGLTDVKKALADSVNSFFYLLGGGGFSIQNGLGIEKINLYSSRFGLGRVLGLDLPGENDGFLPTEDWKKAVKKEPWYIGDTYHVSIGQGDLLVTPLQVATYTAAIANGGIVYKPHVVKETVDPNDQSVYTIKPAILDSGFIEEKYIKIVQQGLRQGVTHGSGRRLYNLPIQIAGKTGTAQWHPTKDNHAWFTSYAPYNNPEIVVTILIEEGKEGSSVAVPIAEDFYRWYTLYKNSS